LKYVWAFDSTMVLRTTLRERGQQKCGLPQMTVSGTGCGEASVNTSDILSGRVNKSRHSEQEGVITSENEGEASEQDGSTKGRMSSDIAEQK